MALRLWLATIPVVGPVLAFLISPLGAALVAFMAGLWIGWDQRGERDKVAELRDQIANLQEAARISARLAEHHAEREAEATQKIQEIEEAADAEEARLRSIARPGAAGAGRDDLERLHKLLGPNAR